MITKDEVIKIMDIAKEYGINDARIQITEKFMYSFHGYMFGDVLTGTFVNTESIDIDELIYNIKEMASNHQEKKKMKIEKLRKEIERLEAA